MNCRTLGTASVRINHWRIHTITLLHRKFYFNTVRMDHFLSFLRAHSFLSFFIKYLLSTSVQFSSVAQSCLTLCAPMNRSTPGLPVPHQLPEFTQTHAHRVGDAIQPSHPLSSPSPPAPNPSKHQGLFQWVNSSHEVAKVLEFQLQHQSQWTPRTYHFQDGLVGSYSTSNTKFNITQWYIEISKE